MAGSRSGTLQGTVVGPWRVQHFVGAGSMGGVYVVEHTRLRSRAAAKFLHPDLLADSMAVARFQAEAMAVSQLAHPNIVSVFDVGVLPDGRPYFVMEYLEGRSLEAELAEADFPLSRVAQVVAQVAAGLDRAHARGVVHRDLKPANVMVMKLGHEDFVKVIDFGIAKLLTPTGPRLTVGPALLGTPDYMAPEQIRGEVVDGRADVYALGAMTWELLVGRPPFWNCSLSEVMTAHLTQRPASPGSLRSAVPEAVSQVVLKALEKQPAARFSSAGAFAAQLVEAIEGSVSPGLERATPLPQWSPEPKRGPQTGVLVVGERRVPVQRAHETSAGGFVATSLSLPPLSEVSLVVEDLPPLRARVVREVSEAQALRWRQPRGLYLEFLEPTARQRAVLDGAAHPDEVAAEEFIERLRARLWGDGYSALGVAPSADMASVRAHGAQLITELERWLERRMTERGRRELAGALVRVKACAEVLGSAPRRAVTDADQSNWRGVGACLADGLSAEEATSLRRTWLESRPGVAARVQHLRDEGRAAVVEGRLPDAIDAIERALLVDPLDVGLHALRRAMVMASGTLPG